MKANFGVAGDQDDLDLGVFPDHFSGQRRPVHLRHHHVRDQQVDRPGVAFQNLQRGLAVVRLEHLVTLVLERPADKGADRILVLDKQNNLGSGQVPGDGVFLGRLGGFNFFGGIKRRKENIKSRALPFLAVDKDRAPGLGNNAVGGGQSEAGSLAHLLGGEERLEHLVEVLFGDPGAGIRDHDADVIVFLEAAAAQFRDVPGGDVLGGDGERPALRHGVPGVDRHVNNHLFELALVGAYLPQILGVGHTQGNLFPNQAADQVGKVGKDIGHVQHLGVERLAPGKGQQLANQISRPVGVLLDLDQVGERLVAGLVAHQKKVAKTEDGGQQVVKVVRDPARQLAHGLHFLRLDELQLKPFGLRGVDQVKDAEAPVAPLQGAEKGLDDILAGGIEEKFQRSLQVLPLLRRLDLLLQRRLGFLGHKIRQDIALQKWFFVVFAKQVETRPVELLNPEIKSIDHRDGDRRIGDIFSELF